MGEVVKFNGITRLNTDPNLVLESALSRGLTEVTIIGYDEDGEEFFSSSQADGGDVLWMIKRAKIKLLRVADDD